MSLRWICCAVALGAAACTHASALSPPVVAQVDGDEHVVVRAEAGQIWWSHNTWSEPHPLWSLPGEGRVENLVVAREANGFVVKFEQDGTAWSGSFSHNPPSQSAHELARREP